MNSTSSLIAGGVILFGAVALANIYLPMSASVARPSHTSTHIATQKLVKPLTTVSVASPGPFVAPPPGPPPSQGAGPSVSNEPNPAPPGATPAATTTAAPTSSSASSPAPPASTAVQSQPASIIVASNSSAGSPDIFSNVGPKHTEQHRAEPAARSSHGKETHRRDPRPKNRGKSVHRKIVARHIIELAPRHSRTPVPLYDRHSSTKGFTLSATLGDHAWVRIGNRKTVMVTIGSVIPGLGTVEKISAQSVRLGNGKILREDR